MHEGKTLFAQLMDFLPWSSFARIVARYNGDRYIKTLRCTEHFRQIRNVPGMLSFGVLSPKRIQRATRFFTSCERNCPA